MAPWPTWFAPKQMYIPLGWQFKSFLHQRSFTYTKHQQTSALAYRLLSKINREAKLLTTTEIFWLYIFTSTQYRLTPTRLLLGPDPPRNQPYFSSPQTKFSFLFRVLVPLPLPILVWYPCWNQCRLGRKCSFLRPRIGTRKRLSSRFETRSSGFYCKSNYCNAIIAAMV